MPVNGMNVGRDYSFGLYDATTGQGVDLGDVQKVSVDALYHQIKSQPYNDVPRYGAIPDGYKGSFEVTRTGAELELLQLRLNEAFNAGGALQPGYLSERVTNSDGSMTMFQYRGVSFTIEKIGDISRDAVVKQTVNFMASEKVQIA